MSTMEILNEIFRQVFDDDSIIVTRESTANDIEEWDSLTHMNLVVAVEAKFKIRFALGELQTLRNVGDMYDLVEKKIKK